MCYCQRVLHHIPFSSQLLIPSILLSKIAEIFVIYSNIFADVYKLFAIDLTWIVFIVMNLRVYLNESAKLFIFRHKPTSSQKNAHSQRTQISMEYCKVSIFTHIFPLTQQRLRMAAYSLPQSGTYIGAVTYL